jgi:hypothetical protein
MVRWLLLAGLAFGLVTGVEKGWVELHWDQFLHDVGVPFVPDPDAQPGAQPGATSLEPRSSSREARNPSL